MRNFLSMHALCIFVADEPSGSSNADSLALMEFYMKKAAQEERLKQPKQSKDEMPPPASLQGSKFDCDCNCVFLGLVYILVKHSSYCALCSNRIIF